MVSLPTWERGLKPVTLIVAISYHWSLPTWERGLKLPLLSGAAPPWVAPHVGAWIETELFIRSAKGSTVAPHVGAWIETVNSSNVAGRKWVAPHVGAWIET